MHDLPSRIADALRPLETVRAAWLFGSAVAGAAGLRSWRRRRGLAKGA